MVISTSLGNSSIIAAKDVKHEQFPAKLYANEDVNQSGSVDALDIQIVINVVLGLGYDACLPDVNRSGAVDAIDIQMVINAVLRLHITYPPPASAYANYNDASDELWLTLDLGGETMSNAFIGLDDVADITEVGVASWLPEKQAWDVYSTASLWPDGWPVDVQVASFQPPIVILNIIAIGPVTLNHPDGIYWGNLDWWAFSSNKEVLPRNPGEPQKIDLGVVFEPASAYANYNDASGELWLTLDLGGETVQNAFIGLDDVADITEVGVASWLPEKQAWDVYSTASLWPDGWPVDVQVASFQPPIVILNIIAIGPVTLNHPDGIYWGNLDWWAFSSNKEVLPRSPGEPQKINLGFNAYHLTIEIIGNGSVQTRELP